GVSQLRGDHVAAAARLGLAVRPAGEAESGEAVGARRAAALCNVALPVGVVERSGGVAAAERGHDVALFPEQPGLVAVAGGGPNRRGGLLAGPRPDVGLPALGKPPPPSLPLPPPP